MAATHEGKQHGVDPGDELQYGNPAAQTEAIAVVRAIYDAFARRDVEAALAYVGPDIEWLPSGTASLTGRVEPYRGHAGVRQYFAEVSEVWEDLRLYADDIRVAGISVVVFGHVEGRVRGHEVTTRALWTWQIRDGVAVSMRVNDLGA